MSVSPYTQSHTFRDEESGDWINITSLVNTRAAAMDNLSLHSLDTVKTHEEIQLPATAKLATNEQVEASTSELPLPQRHRHAGNSVNTISWQRCARWLLAVCFWAICAFLSGMWTFNTSNDIIADCSLANTRRQHCKPITWFNIFATAACLAMCSQATFHLFSLGFSIRKWVIAVLDVGLVAIVGLLAFVGIIMQKGCLDGCVDEL